MRIPTSWLAARCRTAFATAFVAVVYFGSVALAAEGSENGGSCIEDAMIVFDASGSMAGNQGPGIASSPPRIDEVRSALSKVLPSAARYRRIGLVTYGPGPEEQCNVKLNFPPARNATSRILDTVNEMVPAGDTPLTAAVWKAANALDYQSRPGVIVVVTDGEETCGGAPCQLAEDLRAEAAGLTIHVIASRYHSFSWRGANHATELGCLAEASGGVYVKANSEDELIAALRETLDCPRLSKRVTTQGR
ncbi:MAG: VWA domain-containing protein [Methyloceanibacter sp.]|nr:VWA domain-containing protein [Methyloceanibacter sp.]